LVGDGFAKAYEKNLGILRLKNGSWFQFLSNEMDVDKHSGAALHRVHFDEEPREEIYRENMMRLIDYGGEALFTMTPVLGLTWTFREFWEPWEKAREAGQSVEDLTLVQVDMDDNPYLDGKAKARILSGMSLEERQARKEGRFIHFAGQIYSEFSPDDHVVPEPEDVQGCSIVVGIDPGYRHMAAVVYLAVDEEERCVVFDEIAVQHATVQDVVREIQLRNLKWGVTPDWYVIDPSARNKNHQTGRSDQMEFVDNGIAPIPGQNSVTAGINRVKERLQTGRLVFSRFVWGDD
jgi:phage terminase large subunit-like protein